MQEVPINPDDTVHMAHEKEILSTLGAHASADTAKIDVSTAPTDAIGIILSVEGGSAGGIWGTVVTVQMNEPLQFITRFINKRVWADGKAGEDAFRADVRTALLIAPTDYKIPYGVAGTWF